jgi:hypothetical protein
MRALKQLGPEARVIDAMTTGVPTIGQRRRLEEAFRLLQESSAPAVAVVDDSGRLVGLVTSETASQMLTLKKACPRACGSDPGRAPPAPDRYPPSASAPVNRCHEAVRIRRHLRLLP